MEHIDDQFKESNLGIMDIKIKTFIYNLAERITFSEYLKMTPSEARAFLNTFVNDLLSISNSNVSVKEWLVVKRLIVSLAVVSTPMPNEHKEMEIDRNVDLLSMIVGGPMTIRDFSDMLFNERI